MMNRFTMLHGRTSNPLLKVCTSCFHKLMSRSLTRCLCIEYDQRASLPHCESRWRPSCS